MNQYKQSVKIQMSSTKILRFLVNDILDFSKLRAGKFRKDCNRLDLKEHVDDIVQMMVFKSEQNGIVVKVDFENFELQKSSGGTDKIMVCTDH